MKIPMHLDPTKLAEAQDDVINNPVDKSKIQDIIDNLEDFWFEELPKNNLYQRQCLILAGLYYSMLGDNTTTDELLEAFEAAFDAWLDYGYFADKASYLVYVFSAFEWLSATVHLSAIDRLTQKMSAAFDKFNELAFSDGTCLIGDSREGTKWKPTTGQQTLLTDLYSKFRFADVGVELLIEHDFCQTKLERRWNGHSVPWRWGSYRLVIQGNEVALAFRYTGYADKEAGIGSTILSQNVRVKRWLNDKSQWRFFLLQPRMKVVEQSATKIVLKVKSFWGWTLMTRTFDIDQVNRKLTVTDKGGDYTLRNGVKVADSEVFTW